MIFDVPVIQEGIEDNTNNYTRFLIFSKEKNDKTENSKTSIIFSVKHEPGALNQILKEFNDNEKKILDKVFELTANYRIWDNKSFKWIVCKRTSSNFCDRVAYIYGY